MKVSKFEYSMELFAAMTATEIARRQNISNIEAFDIFIQSETANMLFDEETNIEMGCWYLNRLVNNYGSTVRLWLQHTKGCCGW